MGEAKEVECGPRRRGMTSTRAFEPEVYEAGLDRMELKPCRPSGIPSTFSNRLPDNGPRRRSPVESLVGVSPPGAHRTGRERLRSSGSYRPAADLRSIGQWANSVGVQASNVPYPVLSPSSMSPQTFVFRHRPSRETLVEMTQCRVNRRFVVPTIVVPVGLPSSQSASQAPPSVLVPAARRRNGREYHRHNARTGCSDDFFASTSRTHSGERD